MDLFNFHDLTEEDAMVVLASPLPLLPGSVWYKTYWPFLETLALSVPSDGDSTGNIAKAFKEVLNTLPCQICVWHAAAYLEQHPLDLSSRAAAFKWVVDFHNDISVKNKKQPWPVNRALAARLAPLKTTNQQGSNSASNGWFIAGLVLFVLGVVLVGVSAGLFVRSSRL